MNRSVIQYLSEAKDYTKTTNSPWQAIINAVKSYQDRKKNKGPFTPIVKPKDPPKTK